MVNFVIIVAIVVAVYFSRNSFIEAAKPFRCAFRGHQDANWKGLKWCQRCGSVR